MTARADLPYAMLAEWLSADLMAARDDGASAIGASTVVADGRRSHLETASKPKP